MPFAWVLVDKLAISVSKAATPGKVDWDSVLRVAPLERMADLPLAFVQTVLMNSADFGKGVVGALPLMGLVLALAKSGENGPLAGFVRACRSRWAMFAPDRMDVLGYLYCAALGLVFGVGEEILYRGFLQNSFSQDLSWVGGVGGTAIVVAALEYMGTLPGALLSMGISAYLSVLYDTQGQSLAVSIGAHTAFNAAVFAWISSVLVKQFAIEEVEAVERREQARAARRQRRELTSGATRLVVHSVLRSQTVNAARRGRTSSATGHGVLLDANNMTYFDVNGLAATGKTAICPALSRFDEAYARVLIPISDLSIRKANSSIYTCVNFTCPTGNNETFTADCTCTGYQPKVSYVQAVFCVKADVFANLEITGVAAGLRVGSSIQIEVLGFRSQPRVYASSSNVRVQFWTAIVELENGRVVNINWDDSCDTCAIDNCVKSADGSGGNCGVPASQCGTTGVLEKCDPKIYLAWKGTDKAGKYLTSYGNSFTRYRAFSIGGLWNQAYTIGQNFYEETIKSRGEAVWNRVPGWETTQEGANFETET
eukprot:tig00021589_g22731.t1